MEQSAQVLKFEKGEALIRKGDALDQMYLVVDGATQAHIKGRHLTAQSTSANAKVNRLGGDSGAWVGEMAFLDRLGEKERQKAAPSKVERKKNSGDGKEETGKMTEDPKTEEIVQTSSAVAKQIDAPPGPAASKTAFVLYTVLAKEDCKVWKWSFEDMESLMSSSTVSVSETYLICRIPPSSF
jgi:CRP-like cAMP-binding protein